MKKLFTLFFSLAFYFSNAQSVAINNTSTVANSSAMLDVSSTSKGMLIPRMTTAQRTAILNTATGLMVFDTDTNSFWFYQAGWKELQSVSTNPWQKSGNNIYNSNSGNVGVGTSIPAQKLDVNGTAAATSVVIRSGGSVGDCLIRQDANGTIGFRKPVYGLGINYCISLNGIFPSQSRPAPTDSVTSVLGGDPYVGEIMMFAGNFAPKGWAFCNGQLLPIAQNIALYSLLGTTYGGNGVTTFALPDLRNAAPVHAGSNWLLGESNK